MKMKKMLGLLVFLLLLVSCKANPANAINEQLKKIQITNNTLITQINSLTAHDSEELQAAFEFDLNAETMTLESSKMKELLDLRKQEVSEYESHLDSFSKRISELEEIDLENLEKGNSQFNTIKTNLVSLNDLYTNVKAKISELFEAEDNLIKITIAEDPSIQELQETLALVNTKNSEFYGLLSQLKETDIQLVSNLDNWKKALESEEDAETTPNEEVNVPTEETPVVSEPEEPVVENKILYRILDDFRIESIEPVEKPLVLLTIDDSVQPEPDSYTLEIAKTLKENGVILVAEVSNMGCTAEAVDFFIENEMLFAPGKAVNAGGVACSGLEMTQNAMHISWSNEEIDKWLHQIMSNIHYQCAEHGRDGDYVNYVKGANIAGFMKVADAMMAQGIV